MADKDNRHAARTILREGLPDLPQADLLTLLSMVLKQFNAESISAAPRLGVVVGKELNEGSGVYVIRFPNGRAVVVDSNKEPEQIDVPITPSPAPHSPPILPHTLPSNIPDGTWIGDRLPRAEPRWDFLRISTGTETGPITADTLAGTISTYDEGE